MFDPNIIGARTKVEDCANRLAFLGHVFTRASDVPMTDQDSCGLITILFDMEDMLRKAATMLGN